MKDTFNSDFYATCAAVIPTLYIALFVQASAIASLMNRLMQLSNRLSNRLQEFNSPRFLSPLLYFVAYFGIYAISIVGIAILITSIFAERIALTALYQRSASQQSTVLSITELLLYLTIIPRQ